ncbi:hypothetical protein HUJ04_000749 [Dendroctonus ponderosae]|uniref:pectinesterase n=1 Tax=Dendroctonus ponderosae TaxID=77166 RepID=A0AAR5PEP4_DENPD|nr:hypothetical protein HUJ04_000749 [Dendroctonus ponderosae]KAH1011362.1 hypothetical protein HUJ04_000749 [Dendroctonus ponderosae]
MTRKFVSSTCVLAILCASLQPSVALEYPGTETRPILSDEEVSKYTEKNYFSDWEPEEIVIPAYPHYLVSAGESIQEVVNQAINENGPESRIYIKIEAGHYMETVYVKSEIPLTIYGDPDNPEDVHIMSTISAAATAEEYQNIVNENGARYKEGDSAWELYNYCASRDGNIGTDCSPVVWVENENFQLAGVTVHNGATDAQAVALRTGADKIHLMNNRFLGLQDTLGLGIVTRDITKVERVLVHMCYIKGEIDYVYGGAVAVFNMVTFNTGSLKESGSKIVFAPDTPAGRSFGFLVINSNITGDATYIGSNRISLARSWDRGIKSADLYVPGESPNGQLVIRDSNIDDVINIEAPYAAAATSKRPFSTDIKQDRDLDDNTHNRLWEYNNSGQGSPK